MFSEKDKVSPALARVGDEFESCYDCIIIIGQLKLHLLEQLRISELG